MRYDNTRKICLKVNKPVKQFWDISVPVSPGIPIWPGDPSIVLEPFFTHSDTSDTTDAYSTQISRMASSVHLGTHIDAPLHYVPGGASIEQVPLDVLIGPALVVDVPGVDTITPAELDALEVPEGVTRLLFKTRNSQLWHQPEHEFVTDYVALTSEAAAWLVQRDIRLVGIDYLSVEPFHASQPRTHWELLSAGVVIVEGLNLCEVEPGDYTLVCLPIKLVGSDGAPARAVLMREQAQP